MIAVKGSRFKNSTNGMSTALVSIPRDSRFLGILETRSILKIRLEG